MSSTDFAKLVPGFDFLQSLMKGAGSAMPSMSQWIAPTLDPAEIDKRISELRTVQYWLEQNAKMLAATIQALEVQRMTLATLRTMNLPIGDLREGMKLQAFAPTAAVAATASAEPSAAPPAAPRPSAGARKAAPKSGAKASAASKASGPAAGGAVDPMQWWGALTRQFTELASNALKEMPAEPAPRAAAAAAPATTKTRNGKAVRS